MFTPRINGERQHFGGEGILTGRLFFGDGAKLITTPVSGEIWRNGALVVSVYYPGCPLPLLYIYISFFFIFFSPLLPPSTSPLRAKPDSKLERLNLKMLQREKNLTFARLSDTSCGRVAIDDDKSSVREFSNDAPLPPPLPRRIAGIFRLSTIDQPFSFFHPSAASALSLSFSPIFFFLLLLFSFPCSFLNRRCCLVTVRRAIRANNKLVSIVAARNCVERCANAWVICVSLQLGVTSIRNVVKKKKKKERIEKEEWEREREK